MMPEWTDKDERQYEHVKESVLEQGKSEHRAKEIALQFVMTFWTKVREYSLHCFCRRQGPWLWKLANAAASSPDTVGYGLQVQSFSETHAVV
jgi:hypothetical protein